MRRTTRRAAMAMALLVGLPFLPGQALAADNQQKKSDEKPRRQVVLYQLDFTLDETVEGKPSGARNFKMLMTEGETNRVRIGAKVLLSAAEAEPKFTDVGLKFDCKLDERDGYVALDGKLELNDLAAPATNPPTIRNFQVEIETAVPLNNATTIGVYDDGVGKRRYALRVTVTKAK